MILTVVPIPWVVTPRPPNSCTALSHTSVAHLQIATKQRRNGSHSLPCCQVFEQRNLATKLLILLFIAHRIHLPSDGFEPAVNRLDSCSHLAKLIPEDIS